MARYPVGVRFMPTDEELINDHLRRKIRGERCVIPEVEFYEYDPWELPRMFEELSSVPSDGREWFFLCPTRNCNSSRSNRGTKSGFWKVTSRSHEIRARQTNELIGIKKILVFKIHDSSNAKTEWVMHEYLVISNTSTSTQMPYVLCRLKKRAEENVDDTPCNVGGSSNYSRHDVTTEDHQASFSAAGTSFDTIQELGDNSSQYNSSHDQDYYYAEQWSRNYY